MERATEQIALLILGMIGIIEMLAIIFLGGKKAKLYAIISLGYFLHVAIFYISILFLDVPGMRWTVHLRAHGMTTLLIIMTDFLWESIKERRRDQCLNG